MGYRHSRAEILDAAFAVARDRGIASVNFGSTARQSGINDRTVVYYFPTKGELVGAILERLTHDLQAVLSDAFGDDPADVKQLLRRAWPALTTPQNESTFRLYFEILGLAAAGQEPYTSLAKSSGTWWLEWVAQRITGADPAARLRDAATALATIDGLLLLRLVIGPEVSDAAAEAWGITDGSTF